MQVPACMYYILFILAEIFYLNNTCSHYISFCLEEHLVASLHVIFNTVVQKLLTLSGS